MICERPYFNTLAQAEHVTDPEDVCFACDGRGFRRWLDPDAGFGFEPCRVCAGVATGGRFVLRITTPRFRHEIRFHTDDLPKAKYRAERLAAHLYGGTMAVIEVRVVWKPADRSRPEEIVHRVPVAQPERGRAA